MSDAAPFDALDVVRDREAHAELPEAREHVLELELGGELRDRRSSRRPR